LGAKANDRLREKAEFISSKNNAKVKQVRALRQPKARQSSGLLVVEGIFPTGEALAAALAKPGEVQVESILYAPELLSSDFGQEVVQQAGERGVKCYATSDEVFRSMTERENPQGILALVKKRTWQLRELNPENFAWGVALVNPQDAGNLGTIVRTVDAVGAAGVLLLDGGADAHHPNAVRASMGAIFWHPVVRTTFSEFARWAVQHGYWVYGSSAKEGEDYRQVDVYQRPAILLLGSEKEGLSSEQRGICQELVRLPMNGRVTSLNLAVAGGVLLYDMLARGVQGQD
jgi:RNA methyltransferase, TrmH family